MLSSQPSNRPKQVKKVYVREASKEAQLSECLDIGDLPDPPQPKLVEYSHRRNSLKSPNSTSQDFSPLLSGPLDDLLAESRRQIDQYEMQLPSQKAGKIGSSIVHSNSPKPAMTEFMSKSPERLENGELPLVNPPLFNETISRPSMPSFAPSSKQTSETSNAENMGNVTSTDPLACHAENIMRMAMDSTMLGSFCNDTISSSFSNVLDESIPGKAEDLSFDDEDAHAKRRPRNTLRFQDASKVEISAFDLEMAVSDPIRLT